MRDNLIGMIHSPGCLDLETMMGYVHGRLSEKERHRVEVHLSGCELCSEALAGFQLQIETNLIEKDIRDLNKKILRNRSGSGSLLRIAAIILLVFVSSGILYYLISLKDRSNVLTENKTNSPSHDSEFHDNNKVVISPSDKLVGDSIKQISNGVVGYSANTNTNSKTENINSTTFNWTSNDARDTVAPASSQIALEDLKTKDEPSRVTILIPDDQNNSATDSFMAENKIVYKKSETAPTQVAESEDSYNAKEQEQKPLAFSNADIPSMDRAMQFYHFGQYQKAATDFEFLLKQKNDSDKLNEVRWYLANSYIKLDQPKKAKPFLQELFSHSANYKQKADSLLNTIK